MADTTTEKDGADPAEVVALTAVSPSVGRQSAVTTRHLTVDSCGTPGQRHLWARHSGRPGQPLVARLRVRPQMQLSCPESEAAAGGAEPRSGGGANDVVETQQRSPSSDGGLVQHRRRRLVLKAINRSWPTSTSATPAGPSDPRSVTAYLLTVADIEARYEATSCRVRLLASGCKTFLC